MGDGPQTNQGHATYPGSIAEFDLDSRTGFWILAETGNDWTSGTFAIIIKEIGGLVDFRVLIDDWPWRS